MFIVRPDDPPFNRLVDKLIAARWITRSVMHETSKPGDPKAATMQILWTELGKQRMAQLRAIMHEIEHVSFPLQNDELPFLKGLAQTPPTPTDEPPPRF